MKQQIRKADTELAEKKFAEMLEALGFDYKNNPQMKDTPHRVIKMLTQEVFKGEYTDLPKMTAFPNDTKYDGIVFQGDIDVKSMCAHHFMPFKGKAYVAYIPKAKGKVLGLSKLNRIVDYYSRKPQLQENLTKQIHDEIAKIVGKNDGVMVLIEANHMCVAMRGVNQNSTMKTIYSSGAFKKNNSLARTEFLEAINNLN